MEVQIMTTELLAMLGGGALGFIFKLIGTMVSNQALTEGLIKKQKASDDSADRADKRGGPGGVGTQIYCNSCIIWCCCSSILVSS